MAFSRAAAADTSTMDTLTPGTVITSACAGSKLRQAIENKYKKSFMEGPLIFFKSLITQYLELHGLDKDFVIFVNLQNLFKILLLFCVEQFDFKLVL